LVKELQSLGLDVELIPEEGVAIPVPEEGSGPEKVVAAAPVPSLFDEPVKKEKKKKKQK
jgi:hypothetical protein